MVCAGGVCIPTVGLFPLFIMLFKRLYDFIVSGFRFVEGTGGGYIYESAPAGTKTRAVVAPAYTSTAMTVAAPTLAGSAIAAPAIAAPAIGAAAIGAPAIAAPAIATSPAVAASCIAPSVVSGIGAAPAAVMSPAAASAAVMAPAAAVMAPAASYPAHALTQSSTILPTTLISPSAASLTAAAPLTAAVPCATPYGTSYVPCAPANSCAPGAIAYPCPPVVPCAPVVTCAPTAVCCDSSIGTPIVASAAAMQPTVSASPYLASAYSTLETPADAEMKRAINSLAALNSAAGPVSPFLTIPQATLASPAINLVSPAMNIATPAVGTAAPAIAVTTPLASSPIVATPYGSTGIAAAPLASVAPMAASAPLSATAQLCATAPLGAASALNAAYGAPVSVAACNPVVSNASVLPYIADAAVPSYAAASRVYGDARPGRLSKYDMEAVDKMYYRPETAIYPAYGADIAAADSPFKYMSSDAARVTKAYKYGNPARKARYMSGAEAYAATAYVDKSCCMSPAEAAARGYSAVHPAYPSARGALVPMGADTAAAMYGPSASAYSAAAPISGVPAGMYAPAAATAYAPIDMAYRHADGSLAPAYAYKLEGDCPHPGRVVEVSSREQLSYFMKKASRTASQKVVCGYTGADCGPSKRFEKLLAMIACEEYDVCFCQAKPAFDFNQSRLCLTPYVVCYAFDVARQAWVEEARVEGYEPAKIHSTITRFVDDC